MTIEQKSLKLDEIRPCVVFCCEFTERLRIVDVVNRVVVAVLIALAAGVSTDKSARFADTAACCALKLALGKFT